MSSKFSYNALVQYPAASAEQITLNNPKFNNKFKLERLADRLQDCKYMDWGSLVCEDCQKIIVKSAVKYSCLVRFCNEPECRINRQRIAYGYLKDLKIKSKNLLHYVLGFQHCTSYDNSLRKLHKKVLKQLSVQMEKLGTPLKSLVVFDFTGVKGNIFPHLHCVNLPVKDFRLFFSNLKICQKLISDKLKIPFTIRFKGYSKTIPVLKYFANRIAGIFGNLKDNTCYGFSNFMNLEEYFNNIYRKKTLVLVNLRTRKRSNVPYLLDNLPKICPYCGSTHLKIIPNSILNCNSEQIRTGEADNFNKSLISANEIIQSERKEKYFSNYCTALNKKPIELTITDKLNLLAFNKT
jgi:hypothetical protein